MGLLTFDSTPISALLGADLLPAPLSYQPLFNHPVTSLSLTQVHYVLGAPCKQCEKNLKDFRIKNKKREEQGKERLEGDPSLSYDTHYMDPKTNQENQLCKTCYEVKGERERDCLSVN